MRRTATPLYIGVVGPAGSGKDTFANYLVEQYGFKHVSMSELIGKYITEHASGNLDRANLQKVGNELREKEGSDFWMQKALQDSHLRLVVSGIRTEGEAELLRKKGGIIIALDAAPEIRFKRGSGRKSDKDNVDFDEFMRMDRYELKNENPASQNILAVRNMANYVLDNTGTLGDLCKLIDDIIPRYL